MMSLHSLVTVYILQLPHIKGVRSRSRVDALSELWYLFLKGGNSTFIAAIASGFIFTVRILVTRITTARMTQIERKWDLITKRSNLMIFILPHNIE